MKIIIETLKTGWNVKVGNKYTDLLSVEETVAIVSTLLIENSPKTCLNWLQTKKEHNKVNEEFKNNNLQYHLDDKINEILNNLSFYSNYFKTLNIPYDCIFSFQDLIEASANDKLMREHYDKLDNNYKKQIIQIINDNIK